MCSRSPVALMKPGPCCAKLLSILKGIQQVKIEDRFGWCRKVTEVKGLLVLTDVLVRVESSRVKTPLDKLFFIILDFPSLPYK